MSVITVVALIGWGTAAVGWGAWYIRGQRTEAQIAEAESHRDIAQASAETALHTADAVGNAIAPLAAKVDLAMQVTDQCRWVCSGDHYDEDACVTCILCAQVAGETIEGSTCERVVHEYLSEQQWDRCQGADDTMQPDETIKDDAKRATDLAARRAAKVAACFDHASKRR